MNIGAIYLSKQISENKEKPTWMYREHPINNVDSGWRVFSGTESESFLEDSSNFVLVTADFLIKIDDDIKINLLAPIGSSFERSETNGEWIPVDKGTEYP